jgi:prepilin-type N-terminal cleavage/methylation domain-containing protein
MSSRLDCGMMDLKKYRNLQPATRNLQSSGFTLLEILLAVSILAIILAAIYTSFSTAARNVEQAETIRDSTDLARTLVAKISDDVANVYVKSSLKYTAFRGKKEEAGTGGGSIRHDSISMTTLTNWRRLDSKEMELWEVGYFFKEKPDGTGFVMMRREKRELSNDVPVGEGGVEYQITDRIESLQFRYNTGGDTWTDEWSRRDLPKIVEIALMLDSGMTYTSRVEVYNPYN